MYLLTMGWNIVYQFRKAPSEIDQYLKIMPLITLVNNARFRFNELQEFYLRKRRQLVNHPENQERKDKSVITREGYSSGLSDFQSVLSTFTRYRCLWCWRAVLGATTLGYYS